MRGIGGARFRMLTAGSRLVDDLAASPANARPGAGHSTYG